MLKFELDSAILMENDGQLDNYCQHGFLTISFYLLEIATELNGHVFIYCCCSHNLHQIIRCHILHLERKIHLMRYYTVSIQYFVSNILNVD